MRHSSIRVLIIDDDEKLLECLNAEIDHATGLKCIGVFTSFEKAAANISRKLPHVIILDLGMPGGIDGVEAATIITRQWPRIKTIIFTGDSRDERIYSAFHAGATGFLLKSGQQDELIKGIRRAYAGDCPISPEIAKSLIVWHRRRELMFPHLSPTEKLIMAGFNRGKIGKEIASELNISHHTVREHANSILHKLGVSNLRIAAHLQREALN